jgi:hypothetical protein
MSNRHVESGGEGKRPGSWDEIDAELHDLQRLAERLPHSHRCRAFVLALQALRALWQGDGAYANALLSEIAEAGSHVDPRYSMMSIGAKRHLVAVLSDDFEEIDRDETCRTTGGASYALPRPYLCALAHRRFEIGMVDEAREGFEFPSRHDYDDLQHDVTYLILLLRWTLCDLEVADALLALGHRAGAHDAGPALGGAHAHRPGQVAARARRRGRPRPGGRRAAAGRRRVSGARRAGHHEAAPSRCGRSWWGG